MLLVGVALAAGLSGQPRALVAVDGPVAVLSGKGELLWWTPPATSGVALRPHTQIGPVAAGPTQLFTAGGWDPTVSSWMPGSQAPSWSAHPFDTVVTALAACPDGSVVAAGNNRAQRPAVKEEIPLGTALLQAIRPDGMAGERVDTQEPGEIRALACTAAGILWAPAAGGLRRHVGGASIPVAGVEGVVRALTATADGAVLATDAGVFRVVGAGPATLLLARPPGSTRILALASIGAEIVGATSEGLFSVAGGAFPKTVAAKPASFAVVRGRLLVLREDGTLETWDPAARRLVTSAPVPRGP